MGVLTGKTAIVTGASRGIGKAIAQQLEADGANVLRTARSACSGAWIAADLREPDAAVAVVRKAIDTFGSIDILVNNAGATKRGEFEDLTEADWQDGFALKLFGGVRLTRAAWPHLRERRGSVVYIAGSGGRTPGAQFSIGGSVNAALLSLTKSLADTGLRDGIQVNCVNPGPVRTERLELRLSKLATDRDEAERLLLDQEKIARVAEPEEIAALVAFIVGPNGRSLHGSLIDIDGGSTKTI